MNHFTKKHVQGNRNVSPPPNTIPLYEEVNLGRRTPSVDYLANIAYDIIQKST